MNDIREMAIAYSKELLDYFSYSTGKSFIIKKIKLKLSEFCRDKEEIELEEIIYTIKNIIEYIFDYCFNCELREDILIVRKLSEKFYHIFSLYKAKKNAINAKNIKEQEHYMQEYYRLLEEKK